MSATHKWQNTNVPSTTIEYTTDGSASPVFGHTGFCGTCKHKHWLYKSNLSSKPKIGSEISDTAAILWNEITSSTVAKDAGLCGAHQIHALVRFAKLDLLQTLFDEAFESHGESQKCFLAVLRDSLMAECKKDGEKIHVKSFLSLRPGSDVPAAGSNDSIAGSVDASAGSDGPTDVAECDSVA